MNIVALLGRLTYDPEIRRTNEGMCIANYNLAVDRSKDKTDFIRCTAIGKNGEFAEKYLKKGMKIGVTGQLQTDSYEKDGKKVYTWCVLVNHHDFCESKSTESIAPAEDFMSIPDGLESELPFV